MIDAWEGGVPDAQRPAQAESNARLTYRFDRPTKTALEIALEGLPSFDGELLSIDLQRGDSIAEITGRVRAETWARNPEVWGGLPGHEDAIYFGRIQAYLGGDPRFRVLVKPAWCEGCEGIQEAIFLRNNESGYLVGGPRRARRSP